MNYNMTYTKEILNAEGTQHQIVEHYFDGRTQVISEHQDIYQHWLSHGNQPTVVPFKK